MGDEAFRPLVVMPAYNEEEALGGVLAEVFDRLPGWGVVVISDGSVDRTAQVAKEAGAVVLDLPFNLGVGGALRAGFQYAVRFGYTHALQLDADGQHDPGEVPKLVETMRSTGAGLVIGARFAGTGAYQVRGPRRWAMVVLAKILSRVCRTTLTDTTSGFKLMDRDALTLFSNDYPAEYLGDTIEALVVAARKGVVVRQVGVEMRDRKGGQPSHSPFKAAIFLLRAVVVLVLALTRAMPRGKG